MEKVKLEGMKKGKTMHDLIKTWNDRRAQNKILLPISWATITGNENLFKQNAAKHKKQATNKCLLFKDNWDFLNFPIVQLFPFS
jgi:hypothetical protein